jgi:hypothetical protein
MALILAHTVEMEYYEMKIEDILQSSIFSQVQTSKTIQEDEVAKL